MLWGARLVHIVINWGILYVEKFWRGKISLLIHINSGITDRLPADSPNFSSPIASTQMIHQKFPLQNFPMYGVRY